MTKRLSICVTAPDKKGGPNRCENPRKSEKSMGYSNHGFGGTGGGAGRSLGGCPVVWVAGVQRDVRIYGAEVSGIAKLVKGKNKIS